MSSRIVFAFMASLLACGTIGCNSDSDEQATTNGVNDIAKACSIRTQWTKSSTPTCTDCLATSSVPRCECSTHDYAGRCSEQQTARNQEPACQGVAECVYGCNDDCACIEACYAGKDVCRERGAALDGCLAEVCDSFCR